jgi:predicted small metal-binding protein
MQLRPIKAIMAKEEYKELSCSDVGMACGFKVRAKTEAEVMKHAKTHAAEAHSLKEISADTEKKIKAAVKTVSTDVPEKKK